MKIQTLPFFIAALFVHQAHADLLVYEGFSGYTVDTTIVGQGPAKTGFTGNWSQTGGMAAGVVDYVPRSSGLSYENYAPTSNGSLEHFRASGGSHAKTLTRGLNYVMDNTDDYFLSFLVSYSGGATADSTLTFTNEKNRPSVFSINHSTGAFSFTPNGGSATVFNSNLAADETHLIVLRAYQQSEGNPNSAFFERYDIWVNPEITADPNPTLANLGTADGSGWGILRFFDGGSNPLPFNTLRFSNTLSEGGSVTTDEIVISQSLSDIVAIPEPGTLVLLGIALGTLAIFRRRK
ncbi:MAG: PEP-CTERM sorting domain-containing protein [Verrucomicrobia bacterium]|nr:PEP-CTERM sorting domain-containing protein [Verrucomicrobiota bacterium]MCH8512121.1 PEP-CTERM sorting domain-containing protein [Kiritimatiellia bacterium]